MEYQNSASNPPERKISRFLCRYFHVFFISAYLFILCKAMISCYRIKEFSYLHVIILFISGILLYKLYLLIPTEIIVKGTAFLFIFSAPLFFIKRHQLETLWNIHIVQNFNSINMGIYLESETYFHQFLPFLFFLIPATTAVCLMLTAKGKGELSIIFLSIYMFSFWNNGLDRLLSRLTPFYILLTILYFSLCRYERIISKTGGSHAKINVTFKNILLYTLFSAVSITLLASASIFLFGFKSIVQLKSDYEIRELRLLNGSKKSVFDLASTGYGSYDGKLGGPIHLDTLIALKVKADYPTYLRGSIKDYYDGRSWSKSMDEYTEQGMESLTVQTQDFNLRMTGNIKEKPDTRKMSIYHYGLATSTLFSPNNTLSISAKDGKVMYDSSYIFMLMGERTVSEPYTLKYYISKTGIENFKRLVESNQSISYESGSTNAEKAEFYRDNVLQFYKPCLQVPQNISPRTYKLLEDIIKECNTTEEKVERIMSYLSLNYPYSLNVSQVPENTDFIDYFLFREKKGYCTYFASAATIMCRIAGIPARYVEGFNMDEERDSSGLYVVRNHKAHAWTEILVSPESNLWCIVDCVPQGAQISDISNSGPYRDKFDDDRYKSSDGRFSNMADAERGGGNLHYYDSLLDILLYPLLIIPAALLLLLSVYIIYRLIVFSKRTNRILKPESNIPFYRHLVSRLKAMGISFPEECCELEYIKSIEDRELSRLLEKVLEACYFEHYGGISNSSLIDKKILNHMIEKHIRKKSGFIKYWYCIIRRS